MTVLRVNVCHVQNTGERTRRDHHLRLGAALAVIGLATAGCTGGGGSGAAGPNGSGEQNAPLAEAVARIEAHSFGAVTGIRRL